MPEFHGHYPDTSSSCAACRAYGEGVEAEKRGDKPGMVVAGLRWVRAAYGSDAPGPRELGGIHRHVDS